MNSAESPEIPLAADVATILFYFANITIILLYRLVQHALCSLLESFFLAIRAWLI
jgi:hypothetical protein